VKTWRLLFLVSTVALGCLLAIPIFAQQPGTTSCASFRFFPETGHNVCDQFLTFFESHGGLPILGYPITEQFDENGRLVQYFQRVRMEYNPDLPPALQVQLGLLGDYLAPADQKGSLSDSEIPATNDPQHRYFPETGHSVAYAFLDFFDAHGGSEVFGYPVTEFVNENGRMLQYFQHALMEWDSNGREIQLHDLGTLWLDRQRGRTVLENAALRASDAVRPDPTATEVLALNSTVSVRDAFTAPEGDQTVWVYVMDQKGDPVAGAEVNLVGPILRDGAIPMPPTDADGHTQVTFDFADLTLGQMVVLQVRVSYGSLTIHDWAVFYSWL
jgi:hypothetical protein